MAIKRIVMPLPLSDFDPTESAVTWKILTEHGVQIVFSTPSSKPAMADRRMLTGEGLGVFASFLKADRLGLSAYRSMSHSPEFLNPIPWDKIDPLSFTGIVLAGGHAQGMKEYLESRILQEKVATFFLLNKVVGAICHGTVLVARSMTKGQKSVLYGRKTTALLSTQEISAWALTCIWLKNYYRIYPETVEAEVTRALQSSNDFIAGPWALKRDSLDNLQYGFVVQDDNYVSARWPGDAHFFALSVLKKVQEHNES